MRSMIKISRSKYYAWFLTLLLIMISGYIALYRLGFSPFENWDEAWYADMTRNILKTGELIVLKWNFFPLLDKPPLYMWLSTGVSFILGLNEFSFRLVSAVCGMSVIIATVMLSYRWYGKISAFFAFGTLACNHLFIWRIRSGNLDSLLTALIFLIFILCLRSWKYRYEAIGFVFALIYLSKLTVVFFPLVGFLLSELIYNRKTLVFNIERFILGVFFFFIPVGIWLQLGKLEVGDVFIQYYLFGADQGVSKMRLAFFNKDYIDHLYYALQRRFFWVFLVGVGVSVRLLKQKKNFLILFFALALLFQLSFTERNNNWYLLPSMPFWSLLVAGGISWIIKKIRFYPIILSIFLISTYLFGKTFFVNIMPIINSYGPVDQKESALKIRSLTLPDEVIVRLDHLYPTTIYYSERKILASPDGSSGETQLFIGRAELMTAIQEKKIKWMVGKTGDVDVMMKKLSDNNCERIPINGTEDIIHCPKTNL